jgi:hypothetical protein
VIANARAGRPPRLLPRKEVDRLLAVADILDRDILRPPGHAGHVAEEMAELDGALPALREFRPVARDRRVEINDTAIDQQHRCHRRHRLGR